MIRAIGTVDDLKLEVSTLKDKIIALQSKIIGSPNPQLFVADGDDHTDAEAALEADKEELRETSLRLENAKRAIGPAEEDVAAVKEKHNSKSHLVGMSDTILMLNQYASRAIKITSTVSMIKRTPLCSMGSTIS